jgi:hypothetical protein
MSRLTLPSGQKALLFVEHQTIERRKRHRRLTLAFEVASRCSSKDPFCKSVGRYLAARKLVAIHDLRQTLSKADREVLMREIVPELFEKGSGRAKTMLRLAKLALQHEPERSLERAPGWLHGRGQVLD